MRLVLSALCALHISCVLGTPLAHADVLYFDPDCESKQKAIHADIRAAIVCTSDSDCVQEHFGCPFGCGTLVNRNKVKAIKAKIDALRCAPCYYMCMAPKKIEPGCRGGVCVNVAPDPNPIPRSGPDPGIIPRF